MRKPPSPSLPSLSLPSPRSWGMSNLPLLQYCCSPLSHRLSGHSPLQLLPAPRHPPHLSSDISKGCSQPGKQWVRTVLPEHRGQAQSEAEKGLDCGDSACSLVVQGDLPQTFSSAHTPWLPLVILLLLASLLPLVYSSNFRGTTSRKSINLRSTHPGNPDSFPSQS